ncbi:MAG: AMP-binding protein [Terrimicrobiaceae bacterium]
MKAVPRGGTPKGRAALEAEQLEKLRSLLDTIVPANAFYTAKLRDCEKITSLEDFAQLVPCTTKSELIEDQKAHPPYGTNLTFPLERYTRFSQTSGTSGQPLRWLDTPESWEWMLGNWRTIYRAAGARAGDRAFFAFSFGPFLGFWTSFEAAAKLGLLCIPGGGLSSEARMQAIIETGATILCCTPTYALRLGGIGTAGSRVRAIIVAGEPGGSIPSTRAQIERLWPGARVFDHHGMTEVGPVSYECPEQPGTLCVIEPSYIAEIVDPITGQPVGRGESGELLLTTLGRTASPLLRYQTGDVVKKAFVNDTLAFEGGILGRSDDMVIVRGVNVYPTAVERIIREHANIAEYRVELRKAGAMDEIAITIEPADGCAAPDELAANLESELKSAFALRVPVSIAAPGGLPRFEMKAKRWVRL